MPKIVVARDQAHRLGPGSPGNPYQRQSLGFLVRRPVVEPLHLGHCQQAQPGVADMRPRFGRIHPVEQRLGQVVAHLDSHAAKLTGQRHKLAEGQAGDRHVVQGEVDHSRSSLPRQFLWPDHPRTSAVASIGRGENPSFLTKSPATA
jgi:hypothetical protein